MIDLMADLADYIDGLVVEEPTRIYVKRSPRTTGHQKSHIVLFDSTHLGGHGKTICGLEYTLGAWREVRENPEQHLCTHCHGISEGKTPFPKKLEHGDVKSDPYEDGEFLMYCVYCNTWLPFYDDADKELLEHEGEKHD